MKKLILAFAALIFCQGTNAKASLQTDLYQIDTYKIIGNKNKSNAEKAEALAQAAEQLVQMDGFMYVHELATMALRYDSNNKRAKFWKNYSNTLETFRGWYSRFETLVAKRPAAETKKFYQNIKDAKKYSAFYSFISEDRPSLKDEKDIQEFLDSHVEALDDYRKYIKSSKNDDLRITIYKLSNSKPLSDRWGLHCYVNRSIRKETLLKRSYPIYFINGCQVQTTLAAHLDRSDYEALQHIIAGNQILFSVMNAYRLDGAISAVDSSQGLSNRGIVNTFFSNDSFGVLRSEVFMKIVQSLGVDALAGHKQFVRQKNSLCPNGVEVENQRPRQLFNRGICVINEEQNYATITQLVETTLAGGVIDAVVSQKEVNNWYGSFKDQPTIKPKALLSPSDEVLYQTRMSVASPFASPMRDLRIIAPTLWNDCDGVAEIAAGDAGGILPHSDSSLVLRALNNNCQ